MKRTTAAESTLASGSLQGIAVPLGDVGSQDYYKPDSEQYKQCKRALAEMICNDIQPTSIVNDPGFLNYSYVLNYKFLVPSRDTMDNEIGSLYEERKRATEYKIRHDVNRYCITFDIWTSRAQDSYISLTVHYVDTHDWSLRDLRLGAHPFPGSHDAESMADKIKELLRDWELPLEKLVAVTCDNASNNVKCIRDYFDVKRAPCVGHILNLAVNDGLKVRGISEAVARCRKLVEHFSRSRTASEQLEKVQSQMQLKKHKLIQDVVTRWNSTYLMIERLLEQKEAIVQVVKDTLPHANAPVPTYLPSDGEWETIERLVPILVPFYDATVWLSGSSYVTISAVGPTVCELKKVLKVQGQDPAEIRRLKEAVQSKLKKYFDKESEESFLDECTYLDPRFRDFPHKLESKRGVEDKLMEELARIISDDMSANPTMQQGVTESVSSVGMSTTERPTGLSRLLSTIMSPSDAPVQQDPETSHQDIARREVARYNALPVPSINVCPLEWWKMHHSSFKYMCQLANKYLCVVATSVPSECLFSIAGKIVSGKRSRLTPEHTHMLCYLHDNNTVAHKHLPQYRRMWPVCNCKQCVALLAEKGHADI